MCDTLYKKVDTLYKKVVYNIPEEGEKAKDWSEAARASATEFITSLALSEYEEQKIETNMQVNSAVLQVMLKFRQVRIWRSSAHLL